MQTPLNKSAQAPPLAVGLSEAARLLGISKSLAYKLAASGEIPTIAMGERRKIVPMAAIEKLVAQWDSQ
ncbi:MAG: excisionase family DNA-binding protein [Syntrophomonadaceae bacterium]|jgi:excisionase family DNA binding protein|nr:excisionase family DNA-binding protein [Syntrophomonadaceae bacterium]